MSPAQTKQTNSWQAPGNQTGIPQWLEQFLNSQGGLQGLLYQHGGIQGLLNLIQQQSQLQQAQVEDARIKAAAPPPSADPYGWNDWMATNYPTGEKGKPPPGWVPPPVWQGGYVAPTNPYYSGATAGNLGTNDQYTRFQPDAEIQALQNIPPGTTGKDLIQYLPSALKPQGTPGQIADLQNTYNQNLAAYNADPTNKDALHQVTLANQALQSAQYGPMWQAINSTTDVDDLMRVLQPQSSLYRPPEPLNKYEHATQYGYGTNGRMSTGDWQNMMQTLKAGGWDRSMGFGPQVFKRPDGTPYADAQQKTLNDLLYTASPASPHRQTPGGYNIVNMGGGKEWSVDPEWQKAHYGTTGEAPPDPFEGLQAAINRDAYVNETLGGGFYGGVIPEQDAINTWGDRTIGGSHDPHFPTPQLALGASPDQNNYDTYAGWAADQGAAFGTAPWAADSPWGHAMGYDDETKYNQPTAPPTAWQPTPQFGQNTWSGTKGWGNMKGQQNNAWGGSSTQQQQQPMSFGVSPWNNPWGMK